MFGKIACAATLAAAVVGVSLYASADGSSRAEFPTDYRDWAVAKTTLIGPNSAGFPSNGGLHVFHANKEARRTYAARPFDERAILVDERVHFAENANGVWREGATVSVAVMLKDSRHCAETGGWCFNMFIGDDRTIGLPAEAQKTCFVQCHSKIPERDFVFSDFRRP